MKASEIIVSHGHSPFFRASCGCIGFYFGEQGDWGKDKNVPLWSIVKACDAEHDENIGLSNGKRTFDDDKDYAPLTVEETLALIKFLNWLIHRGQQLDEFCRGLEWMTKNRPDYPAINHE